MADSSPARPRRSRAALLWLLIAAALVALLWWQLAGGAPKERGRPPVTVSTAKVMKADMPVVLTAIGTVQPVTTATVRPQLAGQIFSIDFTEGQIVRAGQRVAQIDPRPYQAALAQARANLARDQAQLTLNETQASRYRTLLQQDSVARQTYDTAVATAQQFRGTVAADRAAIQTAELNLNYTAIKSPVTGRIGLRQIDLGNYVTPSDANGIATITQEDPIDVSFTLPQAQLGAVQAELAKGAGLVVEAVDQSGQQVLATGRFLTFDNAVDASTGTVRAKARFGNGNGALFPNQFVNVRVTLTTLQNATVVPVSAVRHGVQGDFVFVVQPDSTVRRVMVKSGVATTTEVAIAAGLRPGETVVTEGADSLDDGSRVQLGGGRREGAGAAPGKQTSGHRSGGGQRPAQ